jgi:hypothetical protein
MSEGVRSIVICPKVCGKPAIPLAVTETKRVGAVKTWT